MAAKNDPGVTARDVRNTALWREMEEHFLNVHGPGFGKITGASDPCPHPDGSKILFTGSMWAKLEDTPQTRICVVDTNTGAVTVATDGPNNDKLPKWSPDGQCVAFLSDRAEKGIFQLYIGGADELSKAAPSSPAEGIVEYFDWCPQGTAILIGTAGLGADKAGADGSGDLATGSGDSDVVPAWMPEVHSKADDDAAWRTLWVCDAKGDDMRQVSRQGTNVWEAAWCGPDHAIAIASTAPGEEAWYTAKLVIIELCSGEERVLYESKRQLGLPAASPSGKLVAFAQAVCSDRGIIAGDILLIDPNSKDGTTTSLAIAGTDATQLTWRDENRLFYMGQRGLQTIAGEIDLTSKEVKEIWATSETCGYRYPRASPYAAEGVVAVCESWTRYPEIGIVSKGKYQTVVSLDQGGGQWLLSKIGAVEEVSWKAPDGLEIQGLLYLPTGRTGPYATVLNVHGGPVWAIRNWWGSTSQYVPLLVAQGYAVLCVNPRGSGGRGQGFAEKVYGDMGGADTHDFLSGLDELVARGIADPKRLGVTGGSYGGFISSWIITQSDRFAAAVALAPVTDWFGQHTTSNIPYFDQIFLNSDPYAPGGLYYERSPVRFAGRYPTPVLQVAGAQDRCTPPGNALQYHRALLEHGVESVLVTYPQEGHGVRKFPAFIDFSHRMLSWFGKHMPA